MRHPTQRGPSNPQFRFTNKLIALTIGSGLILLTEFAYAGSATWDLNPGSGDWNTAANWTPMTVPNGSADAATFALSNTTNVSISANTAVNGITFTLAASVYTIMTSPSVMLTLSGVGITNNSGIAQNFVTAVESAGNAGSIKFTNNATAGSQTAFVNKGATGSFVNGGFVEFFNNSTAGSGTFTNDGGVSPEGSGGFIVFNDTSTAGNGTFTNNGGTSRSGSSASGGGDTEFNGSSTAGNGIFTNNAGFGQAGSTRFGGTATAGNASITNIGGTLSAFDGGFTIFGGTTTAGSATINNNGSTDVGQFTGEVGRTEFNQNSTAGTATINNNSGTFGGNTFFDGTLGTPTAGNATINNNGGTVAGASGGVTRFVGSSLFPSSGSATAGNATINNNGGTVIGAGGGETIFDDTSTAANSTLIANGGTHGGQGGQILFEGKSTGGTSRIEIFGNGSLDISRHGPAGVTIGSVEGDGNLFLGANNLTVGSNNLETIFSGVIQDGGSVGGVGGSLTKIGKGTLDLTATNTYTGNTNIDRGILKVDGSIKSNAFVSRNGTLSGTGSVDGAVNNNGKVSPGDSPGTLTVDSFTQTSNGRLLIDIAGSNADQSSVLNVLGAANLNGILAPVLINGFVPTVGEQFVFLNYGSLSGEFSSIRSPIFDHHVEQWSVTYQPTFAILTAEGSRDIPDHGSTLPLLTLSLLGLAIIGWEFARRRC